MVIVFKEKQIATLEDNQDLREVLRSNSESTGGVKTDRKWAGKWASLRLGKCVRGSVGEGVGGLVCLWASLNNKR